MAVSCRKERECYNPVILKAKGEIKKKKKTKTANGSLNKSLSSINAIFQRLLDFHCEPVYQSAAF